MARTFAGGASTDLVSVANQAQIDEIRPITVAFWLNLAAIGSGNDYLVSKWPHDAATGEWDVQFAAGNIAFFADWTTSYAEWHVAAPSTGVWTQVVVTYGYAATSDDPVIYFNGNSQTVSELVTPSGSARAGENKNISIGNSDTGTRALDGSLAEVGFWNRILTIGEISALGKGFSPAFFPRGLAAYLPLTGRYSPEPNRATGGGNSGTVTGTTYRDHPPIIYPSYFGIRKPAAAVSSFMAAWARGSNVLLGVGAR